MGLVLAVAALALLAAFTAASVATMNLRVSSTASSSFTYLPQYKPVAD